ncbi:MAG TPA: hypothetical protein VMR98_04465, partial [Candidatus Polarisedimenticolaceae bacterium]|nr:hypothetical protein [Candidatus Polarisedimenticolaceae bacterium]
MVLGLVPGLGNQSHAAGVNLIANPSVETVDAAGQPTSWQFNQWGAITSTHDRVAKTEGGFALHIKVTAQTSGDAKWYFTPAAVTPGQTYTFTDEYKSTVAAGVVAQYTKTDNTLAYADLGSTPISATYQTATFPFTVPAGVKEVTVFHLLSQPGELWTDNFSLTADAPVPPPSPSNLIPNGSAEIAQGAVPAGWKNNSWGQMTKSFTYENSGQDGIRSLKTVVSGYVSGDAKWYFDPVAVTAGKSYIFSNYYSATVPTDTIVQYTKTDGTFQYVTLGTNPVAAAWALSQYTFTVPAGITSATIFHVIAANGELKVDNYKLVVNEGNPNPAPISDIQN